MKTFYFNLQSKGGVGKSMLTYLQALKNQTDLSIAFIDLDNSTMTSTSQLKFLQENESLLAVKGELEKLNNELNLLKSTEADNFKDREKEIKSQIKALEKSIGSQSNISRLFQIDINDQLKRIDREKFFSVVEALNQRDFSKIYIDFGAPESEQFPKLLSIDFSADEFKDFESLLTAQFVFNVIVAGGAMYESCLNYLTNLITILDNQFEVNVYANMHFFYNQINQLDNLRNFCSKGDIKLIEFGQFNTQQASGMSIIENVKSGKGLNDYTSFAAKTVLKRSLAAL